MTQRWKITVEYDGSGFAGWQRQEGVMTVQQTLEDAIAKFSGEAVRLHCAGRTDAGVHALGQVAHFDLAKAVDGDTIRDAVNYHIRPHAAAIISAEAVAEDFHARFSALGRQYRYVILNRRAPAVLNAHLVWHVGKPLNIPAMHEAAQLLIGEHDFSTFRAQNCQSKSPIKTLDKLTVISQGEEIHFDVKARSFLYHQVRNMVGTLSLVGHGQWTKADFIEALAARDRSKGGPTAPAQGLCFMGVTYP